MAFGPEFAFFILVILSTPIVGYAIGTRVSHRSVVRRELWLLVLAYVWLAGWYTLGLLGSPARMHDLVEHMNCGTIVLFPFLAGWFVVSGYRFEYKRWANAANVCPKCGYSLRGQLAAGCPECGWNRGAGETERQRDGETK